MSRIDESFLIDLDFSSGDIGVSAGGDFDIIAGIKNLKQALYNRLVTVKGTLVHRPEYGVGVQLWKNSLGSFGRQQELALEIRSQFLQDERVISVKSVLIIPDGNGLYVIQYKVEAVGIGELTDEVAPFGDYQI